MYDVIYINRARRWRVLAKAVRHWERASLSGEAFVLAGVLLLAVLVSLAVLADLARA
jgi:hypothetical protein